ncbi:SGNH/GDSL hydrolase family protein [Goodfellowiella coeruleoviolacea]|uniref:Lysophospholipase L1 n=1 Tax=Goodfellowiella coeruleoviolacea TaxID=334858 RepID=A0AAE3GK45_9PSEU|nr:SGNH/GDSL hydrolase family protein [Goodfellowiella coeruleoviolacea]MCP2168897.1 Lysophospholipase L1 [Goodfellowiella coeruleoviolacea]
MSLNGRRLWTAVGAALALVAGIATASNAQDETVASPVASPELAAAEAVNLAGGWVGTWQAAPAAAVANTDGGYVNYAIRNIVHTSIGGQSARIRLANTFSNKPVLMGHVTLAVAESGSGPAAVRGTMRDVTFGGAKSITIPAGAEVLSDPVNLRVPADADLLVTTYTPEPSGPVTHHPLAQQTSYYTQDGDRAAEESGASFTQRTSVWHYVSGVDVRGTAAAGAVVTLGDSITDGADSTPGANHRWPDYLADRLLAQPGPRQLGVLNAGISGNRLLLDGGGFGPNALSRLDRDVLTATGARTVIVLEGINDIQQDPHQTDPQQIIAALRQVVAQAHARGLRVLGGTITPFQGWRVWDETLEATRQAVNEFIRTGGVFDGVVDFDATIRDPKNPLVMRAEFDSGDHLHPNDAGYQAMANAINLRQL